MIWLDKNECASHGIDSIDELSYVQPIGPICLEDSFEISFPVFSSLGNFLKFNSNSNVVFDEPIISAIPPALKQKIRLKYVKPDRKDFAANPKN